MRFDTRTSQHPRLASTRHFKRRSTPILARLIHGKHKPHHSLFTTSLIRQLHITSIFSRPGVEGIHIGIRLVYILTYDVAPLLRTKLINKCMHAIKPISSQEEEKECLPTLLAILPTCQHNQNRTNKHKKHLLKPYPSSVALERERRTKARKFVCLSTPESPSCVHPLAKIPSSKARACNQSSFQEAKN
jgi:hypothetical protein